MNTPIIDPSSLTEEQRKAIKDAYESNQLNLEDATLSYRFVLRGSMSCMMWLFGKSMFEKGE